jgi:amino acid adenylation domain-containing protein
MQDTFRQSPEKLWLSRQLKARKSSRAQEISRRREGDSCLLSFSQQRQWFLDQLTPGNAAYHVPAALRLSGPLNLAALKQAFNEIIRRHEVLRTTFTIVDEQPAQVIGPVFDLALPTVDLRGLNHSDQEALTLELAAQHALAPFDLLRGPLLRTALLRIDEQEHILLAAMHHIVSDGWSMGLLIREVATLYEAFSRGRSSSLPELAIQYADFARWQREWLAGARLEEKLKYWKEQLAEAPVLALPTDKSRPSLQTFEGARCSLVLPESLSAALKELSRQSGATLFMTMLAGFHALLHRYAQQARILTGIPAANRTAETEPLIGLFINTLVLSSDFADDPSFVTLLERLRRYALVAYTHQDLPFELLIDELQIQRDLSYNPLFQVMFSWLDAGWSELKLAGLEVNAVAVEDHTSHFDLTLRVGETGGQLRCVMQYNTALYEEATVRRMLDHYEELLRSVVREPQQRVSRLSLLSEEELKQLREWNETATPYEAEATLPRLFEQQVARAAAAVAVVTGGREVTYGELNERANRVARYLRNLGVGADSRVGLLVDRGLEMVVGLLGIVKTGAAYVPLDPGYPRARLEYMIADAAVSVLLSERASEQLAKEVAPSVGTLLYLDDSWAETGSGANLETRFIDPQNLAYIIYTSGSTGQPKGVMNTHRGICNLLLWQQDTYQLTAADRLLQKTPFSFDISVWELFWPLIAGARLVMAKPGGHQDPAYLREVIEKEQITIIHFVPAMLPVFLEEAGLEQLDSLRKVLCGGEAFNFELQERCFSRLNVELYNRYGPTESAVVVAHWKCERDSKRKIVPIGKPIANTQIYLLDRHYGPAPLGVAGELHIGGVNLARGYFGNPGLTAEKFVPNPFSSAPGARLYKTGDVARYLPDGNIEFLGRIDQQVKIRGFRIELEEIEAVLKQYTGVREVVVVDRELKQRERQLVAYVVGQTETPPTVGELRDHVRSNLPEHMVPAAFVFLPALPLTPSGKIDRRALPLPGKEPSRPTFRSAPLTDLERRISEVWRQVLQVDEVSVDDNFFDIGGHSLLMVQVQRSLADVLRKEIQLVDLFKYPTISSLAKRLGQNGHQPPASHDAQKEKLQSGKTRLQKLKAKQAARVSS